mgnify:FL=1
MLFTNRVMTFMMPGMMLIMNLLTVGIVWVGAHKIDAGSMQVGSMTAFITYAMMIVMAIFNADSNVDHASACSSSSRTYR